MVSKSNKNHKAILLFELFQSGRSLYRLTKLKSINYKIKFSLSLSLYIYIYMYVYVLLLINSF